MLASLLPGLRDLRTPLACGYIWLAAIWTEFGYPTSLTGAPRWLSPVKPALGDLAHVLTLPALLALLSFVAYLIGAMFEFDVMRMQRAIPFRTQQVPGWMPLPAVLIRMSLRLTGYRGVSHESLKALVTRIRAEFATQRRAWAIDHRADTLDQVRQTLRAVSRGPVERPSRVDEAVQSIFVSRTDNDAQDRAVWLVALAMLFEVPDLATRLQLSAEKVYDRYDRLVAEANFRANLAVPLTALAIVLAVHFGAGWLWALIVPAALALQGTIRTRRPGDLLVDAVSAGNIQSTVLDRSIQVVVERSESGRRLRRRHA